MFLIWSLYPRGGYFFKFIYWLVLGKFECAQLQCLLCTFVVLFFFGPQKTHKKLFLFFILKKTGEVGIMIVGAQGGDFSALPWGG